MLLRVLPWGLIHICKQQHGGHNRTHLLFWSLLPPPNGSTEMSINQRSAASVFAVSPVTPWNVYSPCILGKIFWANCASVIRLLQRYCRKQNSGSNSNCRTKSLCVRDVSCFLNKGKQVREVHRKGTFEQAVGFESQGSAFQGLRWGTTDTNQPNSKRLHFILIPFPRLPRVWTH